MKSKIHIATHDFSFIELEVDGSLEEIKGTHDDMYSLCSEGFGHTPQEWARVRNQYVNTGELEIEDYEKCNKAQKYFINQLKLVIKSNK